MRYAIEILPLDFSRGNVVNVQIKGFRRVIGSSLVERRDGIIMSGANGGQQKMIQCALIVEWDPEGAEETHRFVGIPMGMCIETDGIGATNLEHAATIIVAGHPPFAIYSVPTLSEQKRKAIEVVQ